MTEHQSRTHNIATEAQVRLNSAIQLVELGLTCTAITTLREMCATVMRQISASTGETVPVQEKA